MSRNVRWTIGALAAALWVAPAVAQTGSTSQGQEKPYTTGNGADPTRSNTDPDAAPASHGDAAASGSASDTSGSARSAGASGSSSDPGATTAGAGTSDTASTAAKLHAGNQAEIEAGRYMQQHAQSSKVKDFAKKMVNDHRSLDRDLMSFAKKKNIDLAGGSSAAASEKEHAKQQLTELQGMSGAEADQHYMTMMVQDHQQDVSDVRTAEQQAKRSNEKDFATLLGKTAKKMEGHLKDAQKIQRDLTQRQARNPAR